jgi:hypothetical protein
MPLSRFLQAYLAGEQLKRQDEERGDRLSESAKDRSLRQQQLTMQGEENRAAAERFNQSFGLQQKSFDAAQQSRAIDLLTSGAADPAAGGFTIPAMRGTVPGIDLTAAYGPQAEVPQTDRPLSPVQIPSGVSFNSQEISGKIPGSVNVGGIDLSMVPATVQVERQAALQDALEEKTYNRGLQRLNQRARQLFPNDPEMQHIWVTSGGQVGKLLDDPAGAAAALLSLAPSTDGRPMPLMQRVNSLMKLVQLRQNPFTSMLTNMRMNDLSNQMSGEAELAEIHREVMTDPIFQNKDPQAQYQETLVRLANRAQLNPAKYAKALEFARQNRPPQKPGGGTSILQFFPNVEKPVTTAR